MPFWFHHPRKNTLEPGKIQTRAARLVRVVTSFSNKKGLSGLGKIIWGDVVEVYEILSDKENRNMD